MKHIKKGRPPRELISWLAENKGTPNYCYEGGKFPRAEAKKALLEEQGYLCAYTMRRIEVGSSHIEHFKPQEQCKEEGKGEDVSYANLLACFPSNGGDTSWGYGAPLKKGEYRAEHLLSPMKATCESRLRYEPSGRIEAKNSDDVVASDTIRVLNLNHDDLVEFRLVAMKAAGVHVLSDEPLGSVGAVERLVKYVKEMHGDGRFTEYCVAIEHAAREHLKRLIKIKRKSEFARRSRKKQ